MKEDTARQLIEILSSNFATVIDCKNKLTTLEHVLEAHQPDLYRSYTKMLEGVRQNNNAARAGLAFSALQAKLAQE